VFTLEEDEVALMLVEHYVIEARRLLSDHLAKIARLKSEGSETSEVEQTLGLVEAFLAVIERHIDVLLRQPEAR
jgi:hemerythrin-like domain-containing protein